MQSFRGRQPQLADKCFSCGQISLWANPSSCPSRFRGAAAAPPSSKNTYLWQIPSCIEENGIRWVYNLFNIIKWLGDFEPVELIDNFVEPCDSRFFGSLGKTIYSKGLKNFCSCSFIVRVNFGYVNCVHYFWLCHDNHKLRIGLDKNQLFRHTCVFFFQLCSSFCWILPNCTFHKHSGFISILDYFLTF